MLFADILKGELPAIEFEHTYNPFYCKKRH
jgi:hypothetical protein